MPLKRSYFSSRTWREILVDFFLFLSNFNSSSRPNPFALSPASYLLVVSNIGSTSIPCPTLQWIQTAFLPTPSPPKHHLALGDLAAQSASGITMIPLLPIELRLQILKDVMHMIKEPVIILDLHAMPRGKPLKGKQIRSLPPPSRENSPWVSFYQRRTLGLLGALKNSPRLSFYQRRTLGLLGASKECRDFYFLHFPIVLPCGRERHGQLRIAKKEVLHILNFNNKLGSEHVYQAIGNSYLLDEWWSQLELISFVPFYLTRTFFEQLVFIITRME
jgi:hypothetical protein